METPATGMWGPGDYPADFVAIDGLLRLFEQAKEAQEITSKVYRVTSRICADELAQRMFSRDCLLDLAEDLDARGLVLMTPDDFQDEIFNIAWDRLTPPSSPNTGS